MLTRLKLQLLWSLWLHFSRIPVSLPTDNCLRLFYLPEVSGSFEPTTSITYIVKEPYEASKNSSSVHSSIYSDITLRGEDVSLSFRTSQSPAPLLYVSSFYRQYLILLINKHGEDFCQRFSVLITYSPFVRSATFLCFMDLLCLKPFQHAYISSERFKKCLEEYSNISSNHSNFPLVYSFHT